MSAAAVAIIVAFVILVSGIVSAARRKGLRSALDASDSSGGNHGHGPPLFAPGSDSEVSDGGCDDGSEKLGQRLIDLLGLL